MGKKTKMYWKGRVAPNVVFSVGRNGPIAVCNALVYKGGSGKVIFHIDEEDCNHTLFELIPREIEYNLTMNISVRQRITFKILGDAHLILYGYYIASPYPFSDNISNNVEYELDKAKLYGVLQRGSLFR